MGAGIYRRLSPFISNSTNPTMKLKITILEGDGIGPEVTREAVRVLRAIAMLHGHEF